eukprot:3709830-Ditylum_brightwellii.AAC.1
MTYRDSTVPEGQYSQYLRDIISLKTELRASLFVDHGVLLNANTSKPDLVKASEEKLVRESEPTAGRLTVEDK